MERQVIVQRKGVYMRGEKTILGVLVIAVLITCFGFSAVHAQVPYTIWEGTWFKTNLVFKGYDRNLGGTPDWLPDNGKTSLFFHIGTWTDPNGSIEGDETFAAEVYHYDKDTGWEITPLNLHRIHGNPLDIFIWSQIDTGDFATGNFTTGVGQRITFLARISGKMDKAGTSLQKGTFKTLAGYEIQLEPFYYVSGDTITGNLIIPATFCTSKTNQQYPPCWP